MVFCFLLRPSFTVSYSPATYWCMVFCFLFWIFSCWFSLHVSLCFLVLLFGPYSEEVNWYRGVSSGGRGGQGGRGRLPAAWGPLDQRQPRERGRLQDPPPGGHWGRDVGHRWEGCNQRILRGLREKDKMSSSLNVTDIAGSITVIVSFK